MRIFFVLSVLFPLLGNARMPKEMLWSEEWESVSQEPQQRESLKLGEVEDRWLLEFESSSKNASSRAVCELSERRPDAQATVITCRVTALFSGPERRHVKKVGAIDWAGRKISAGTTLTVRLEPACEAGVAARRVCVQKEPCLLLISVARLACPLR
jgi:hypothetical protein